MVEHQITAFHTELAGRIRAAQAEITEIVKRVGKESDNAVLRAWTVGHELKEARPFVPHGLWGPFLEACNLHPMTAHRYVQLVELYPTREQIIATGMRTGYLALALLPAKAVRGDSAKLTGTQTGKYMRAANDLHKVLNSLDEYDIDLLKNDLRLLYKELSKLFGNEITEI